MIVAWRNVAPENIIDRSLKEWIIRDTKALEKMPILGQKGGDWIWVR